MDPTKLVFGTVGGPKDADPRKENLHRTLKSIPTSQLVTTVSPLTPEQRKALEYMSKIRALMPDIKEVKKHPYLLVASSWVTWTSLTTSRKQ